MSFAQTPQSYQTYTINPTKNINSYDLPQSTENHIKPLYYEKFLKTGHPNAHKKSGIVIPISSTLVRQTQP